ncbi:MAG TPA: NAD(P)-dependent alcohol dehydrogenase, partial [Candidatus Binatia bacterium]|nr:NAD(P)-dependent alcohol dehydrogenase [Candidatus Binatia bacterium]
MEIKRNAPQPAKDRQEERGPAMPDRRKFLIAGLGLAAAPLLTRVATGAPAAQTDVPVGTEPFPVRAYGTSSASSPLQPMQIERRALGPHDVLLDVLYCGVCHSDIHQARNEWPDTVPTTYPVVPGHEIIGRVRAVGNKVTKFKVDDIGGVGCMVDSCGTCENCLADREQNCLNGTTFTYNSPDKVSGGLTFGGYSDKLVVKEHFVVRIPPGVDLPAMAPLLCAGITTFSPMRHWKVEPGQRVGVIGLGGLGHMAVKLAVAYRADVVVFTTTPGKIADAKQMGATDAVLWSNNTAMKRYMNQFDLMISTVPRAYPMQQFVNLLRLDGTLVNVGALEQLKNLDGMMIGFGRKSLAGSMIGGIAETQQVIDY